MAAKMIGGMSSICRGLSVPPSTATPTRMSTITATLQPSNAYSPTFRWKRDLHGTKAPMTANSAPIERTNQSGPRLPASVVVARCAATRTRTATFSQLPRRTWRSQGATLLSAALMDSPSPGHIERCAVGPAVPALPASSARPSLVSSAGCITVV
jgi:hypothetical protein